MRTSSVDFIIMFCIRRYVCRIALILKVYMYLHYRVCVTNSLRCNALSLYIVRHENEIGKKTSEMFDRFIGVSGSTYMQCVRPYMICKFSKHI